MYIIGVTGGICSGKTTVTDLFSELSTPIIDTDVIAREVVEPGTYGYTEIIRAFGNHILTPDKRMNRTYLRKLIFEDKDKRLLLEGILHPLIAEHVRESIKKISAAYCLVSIPLLYETGGYEMLNRILVVETTSETQLQRLIIRDGMNRDDALTILSSQATPVERRTIADDTIHNDGDIKQLRADVAALHTKYLNLANAQN